MPAPAAGTAGRRARRPSPDHIAHPAPCWGPASDPRRPWICGQPHQSLTRPGGRVSTARRSCARVAAIGAGRSRSGPLAAASPCWPLFGTMWRQPGALASCSPSPSRAVDVDAAPGARSALSPTTAAASAFASRRLQRPSPRDRRSRRPLPRPPLPQWRLTLAEHPLARTDVSRPRSPSKGPLRLVLSRSRSLRSLRCGLRASPWRSTVSVSIRALRR